MWVLYRMLLMGGIGPDPVEDQTGLLIGRLVWLAVALPIPIALSIGCVALLSYQTKARRLSGWRRFAVISAAAANAAVVVRQTIYVVQFLHGDMHELVLNDTFRLYSDAVIGVLCMVTVAAITALLVLGRSSSTPTAEQWQRP